MAWDEEAEKLKAAGFSDTETQHIAAGIGQKMVESGAKPEEFDAFFGKPKEPDPGKLTQYFDQQFKANMPNIDPVKEADHEGTKWDAIRTGLKNAAISGAQGSVIGLGVRHGLPDTDVDGPSIFDDSSDKFLHGAERLVQGATQTAADLPVMAAGTALGGVGGAFGLPQGMRAAMTTAYEQGGVHSFKDFWNIATDTAKESAKGFVTGQAAAVGGALGATYTAGSGAAAKAVVPIASEIGAMTTAGALLDGKMPEPKDFLDNAILAGGFHAFGMMKAKLYKTFDQTGLHPHDVAAASLTDPVLSQEMLGRDTQTPQSLSSLKQPEVESHNVVIDGHLVAPDQAAAQGEFDFKGTPADFANDIKNRLTPENRMAAARAHDPAVFKQIESLSRNVRDIQKQIDANVKESQTLKENVVHGEVENPDRDLEISKENRQLRNRLDEVKFGSNASELKGRIEKAYETGNKTLTDNVRDRIRNAKIGLPETEDTKIQTHFNPEFTSVEDHLPSLSDNGKNNIINHETLHGLIGEDNQDPWSESLKNHPELAKLIAPEITSTVKSHTGETTLKIGARPKYKEPATNLDTLARDLYNDQHYSKMLSKETKKMIGEFPISAQPDIQVIRSRDSQKRGEVMIGRQGEGKIKDSPYGVFNYETGEKVSDSLIKILEDNVPKDRMDDFRKYAIYDHAIDLNSKGELTGVNDAEARDFVEKNRATFEEPARKMVEWNNAVLQYAVDGHLLTQEQKDLLVNKYPKYAATNRLTEDMGSLGGAKRGKVIYTRAGSELPFLDPIKSAMEKALNISRQVEENRGKLAAFEQNDIRPSDQKFLEIRNAPSGLEDEGIDKLEASDFGKNADTRANLSESEVGFFDKGQYKIMDFKDPELAKTLKFMGYNNGLMKVLGVFYHPFKASASLARSGISGGLDFIARHIIRSEIFTSMVSDTNRAPFLGTMARIGDAFGKSSNLYVDALKSGALDGVMTDINRDVLNNKSFNIVDKEGMLSRTHNVIKNTFGMFHSAIRLTEEAKRLSVYKDLIAQAGPDATWGDKLEAGWQTSRSSVHGLQQGAGMQGVNAVVAFMHYEVQGLGRTVEAFQENPQRMAVRSALISAASVALWYAGKDDKDIQNLPNYQKNVFWNVKIPGTNEILKIAKPWEQGVIFGSVPERLLDLMYHRNPRAMDGLGETLADMIPIHPPTLFTQWNALHNNLNSFNDREIIPNRLMEQAPESRFASYTSDVAKGIASIFQHIPVASATKLNLDSPIMVDYAISMWGGQMGRIAVQAADKGLQMSGVTAPDSKPAWELADYPFIGGFISRHPTFSAQPLKDFQTAYDDARQNYNTFKAYQKAQDFDKAVEFQEKHPEVLEFKNLESAHNMINGMSKQVQKINMMRGNSMSPSDKKQSMEQYYQTMIVTAKTKLDEIDERRKNK